MMLYRTPEQQQKQQTLYRAACTVAIQALNATGATFDFDTIQAKVKELCGGDEELQKMTMIVLTVALQDATKAK